MRISAPYGYLYPKPAHKCAQVLVRKFMDTPYNERSGSVGIVYTLINSRSDKSTNILKYKRVLLLIILINKHTRRISRHDRGPVRKQSKTATFKYNRELLVPGQI